ncbi:MAG: hypothetical protein DDT26_00023 [Dehalococcoidia bacterium]|nr:hypothetical protein [Chloroflexota bacterium]
MRLTLADASVRRQVLLERFKASEVRSFTPYLRRVDERIRQQLSGGRLTDFRRGRLESQLAGIRQLVRSGFQEYIDSLAPALETLSIDSAVAEASALDLAIGNPGRLAVPAPNQVWAAVNVQPLTMPGSLGGQMLTPFMAQWADSDADMVTNAIRLGYTLGETNDQIIARIRGQSAANFADGVLARSRQHAEVVTRTAIQHVANSARAKVWEDNQDVIDGYQWVATLDTRTSPICRARDGERYEVGQGPLPPAHPGCRSTTVAVFGGEFGAALDEELTRASAGGQVPAGETYYDWLKRQDADFQDQALGPTRGRLFRDGGLDTEEFARLQLNRRFEPMTLDEMRAASPAAFQRAGLDSPVSGLSGVPDFSPLNFDEAMAADRAGRLTGAIPPDAKGSFRQYIGAGYRNINAHMRGLELAEGNTLFQIEQIASALDASSLAEDLELYRGLSARILYDAMNDARGLTPGQALSYVPNPADLVGRVFDESSFMSFSYDRSVARRFADHIADTGVLMRLRARGGETGWISMSPITDYEREIMRRGGKFRIVSWDSETRTLDIEPLP